MYGGLIDFSKSYRGDRFILFSPFLPEGIYQYIPSQLQIVDKADGSPDIKLTLIKGENPLLPPSPYGVLDFRVGFTDHILDALKLARTLNKNAMIRAVKPVGGSLRLRLVDEENELKPITNEIIDMVWNSLGIARFYFRTNDLGAALIKKSIKEGIVALQVMAAIVIEGIAPRVNIKIKFDPRKLYNSIKTFNNNNHDVSWEQLVDYFSQPISSLPIMIIGSTENLSELFAEVAADYYVNRFTRLAFPSISDGLPRLLLLESELIHSGQLQWDLSKVSRVKRIFSLYLDPIVAARNILNSENLSKIIINKIVPSIQTGYKSIHISANLSSYRRGVLQIGIVISAEPNPPFRMHKIIETIVLKPPSDEQRIVLRYAPNESLHYNLLSFVIMKGPDKQVKKIEKQLGEFHEDQIKLNVNDFPVSFITIEASQGLLKLAQIKVVYERWENNCRLCEEFELKSDYSSTSVILPKSSKNATFTIKASSNDSEGVLTLGPFQANSLQIGLHSFPEYGPHEIRINVVFGEKEKLFALELIPQGYPEASENITVLHFTPEKEKRVWQWLAKSPFEPGFRFRIYDVLEKSMNEWSEIYSPFSDLYFNAEDQRVLDGVTL